MADIKLAAMLRQLADATAAAKLRLLSCPQDSDKGVVNQLILDVRKAVDAEYQAALNYLRKAGAE